MPGEGGTLTSGTWLPRIRATRQSNNHPFNHPSIHHRSINRVTPYHDQSGRVGLEVPLKRRFRRDGQRIRQFDAVPLRRRGERCRGLQRLPRSGLSGGEVLHRHVRREELLREEEAVGGADLPLPLRLQRMQQGVLREGARRQGVRPRPSQAAKMIRNSKIIAPRGTEPLFVIFINTICVQFLIIK